MSRRERLYLGDMIEACEKLSRCIQGIEREALEGEGIRYDAVLHNLTVLGEAAKHIPEDVRRRYPDIPWRKIAALRDIVVHQYFGVDRDAVWDVVRNKVPGLLVQLRAARDMLERREET